MIPLIDLRAQHREIWDELQEAFERVLRRSQFILGREVARFEADFATFCDVEHAVGVANGTEGLRLILQALGVGRGDEVITAPNTFIGTTEAISAVGARVVFADVQEETQSLDPTSVEAAVGSRSRAVIPVHLFGFPADLAPLLEIASARGIFVIEDAAQAHGARYRGRPVGGWGTAGSFSFYPAKNLGALGDAGAVVTNDGALADRIRMLRNHGRRDKYLHEMEGWNSRLDELQAAILQVKLRRLEAWTKLRVERARLYDTLLRGLPVTLPMPLPETEPVYHLYVVCCPLRDALQKYLRDHGIETGIHYPMPLHLQPAYRALGYGKGDFPVTEKFAGEILSLPISAHIAEEDVAQVATRIREFYSSHA